MKLIVVMNHFFYKLFPSRQNRQNQTLQEVPNNNTCFQSDKGSKTEAGEGVTDQKTVGVDG